MHSHLHPSIIEHAQSISNNTGITVDDAISRIAKIRGAYYLKLPLLTRVREKSPPFTVHPHFVLSLRREAKWLQNRDLITRSVALDRVAFHAGFHDWKHVIKMAKEYEMTVLKAVEFGFVFALWFPQNPWQEPKWNPSVLEPYGLIHDPRILFAASEQLKQCYFAEDAEGGIYCLGFPKKQPDGSSDMCVRTESFMEEIGADEYIENNLSGLFFFRLTMQKNIPKSLSDAHEFIEKALGPVRWNPQDPLSSLETMQIVDVNNPFGNKSSEIPMRSDNSHKQLPPLNDMSNMQLHIPTVHYVWLNGNFQELDFFTYGT